MLIQIIRDTSLFALASNPKSSDLSPTYDGGSDDNISSINLGPTLNKTQLGL